jgi:hypothetical protein
MPALSKRSHRAAPLWHRFCRITIWLTGQQRVRSVGCAQKGRLR